jgi:hypothetical protein
MSDRDFANDSAEVTFLVRRSNINEASKILEALSETALLVRSSSDRVWTVGVDYKSCA